MLGRLIMLPKYVSETQLLSTLTPQRQAQFLLKIRDKCYWIYNFTRYNAKDEEINPGSEEIKYVTGVYVDRLNQTWELNDVIEALNLLPNVKNKQERKASRKLS